MADRAIHVASRHWQLFAIIGLAFDGPAIALAFPQTVASERVLLAQFRGTPFHAAPLDAGFAVAFVAAWLGASLDYAVVLAAAGRVLRGETPALGASVRDGLSRWPLVLAFTVLQTLIAVLGVLFAFAGGAVGIGVTHAAGLPAALAAIPALVLSVPFVWPLLLLAIAEISVFTERAGFVTAIALAFRRLASPGRFGRTLAIAALASVAVFVPAYAAEFAGAACLAFEPTGTLANVALLAAQIGGNSFCGVLLAIFSVDLRVRAEGFDLESALQPAGAAASPMPPA